MRQFPFQLGENHESVITVKTLVDGHPVLLALDTAASQTVIDLNALLMMGYSIQDLGEAVDIETANGIMQVHKIRVKNLDALGLSRSDFEVLTYDFFEKGLLSEQDGVLGLDFFENTVLTIDFQGQFIVLKSTYSS